MDPQYELPELKATLHLGVRQAEYANTLPIFDVKFYPYTIPGVDAVFAICGGRNEEPIETIIWFQDDAPPCQCKAKLNQCLCSALNSLDWSQAPNGDPLLCVAGAHRQIRIFNITTKHQVATLNGHGGEICDLAISPADPTLLASCGGDKSLRLWSIDQSHQRNPLAAIYYGGGHSDQVVTLAYHRSGRYILTGGMDTKVNLWVVPPNVKEYAGTDHPLRVSYPHFSTTEVHMDFVDCVRFYGDLILSRAAREDKIILWKIDGFNSENTTIPNPPVPTSDAVISSTPVTVPTNSRPNTRSAWGGRLQRLLAFDNPGADDWYVRFSLFHEMGRHPVLVCGNSERKAFFWDLQRLEESGTGVKTQDISARRNISQSKDYSITNPFEPIEAHHTIKVPQKNEQNENSGATGDRNFRAFSWSRDGQWCIGVGDSAMINVFQRWKNGVPNPDQDEEITQPIS